METSSASCRSDLEHEEQEQAEPSRYEIQFMPTRSTTAITAASQRIEEGSTVDLSGVELSLSLDPTQIMPTRSTTAITAASQRIEEGSTADFLGVEFSLSLDPTPAPSLLTSQSASHPPVSSSADSETTLSRSSDAADDGGGRGHSAEVIEKEHLFDKVLTPSDVGKLNRLVIPKQHAEKCFPLNAAAKEKGLLLSFEDRTGKLWRFRYSYWNMSQSYVLTKGWSRFVKEKRLDAGDTVSFCRGAAEATRGRLFIDGSRRADVRDPHRLPDLPLPLPMGSGGFFMPPAAPAKLYDRSVLPWDLGSINIDASSTGSAPLAHMEPPPPAMLSGVGETSRNFFLRDSKRRKDGRDPHRLPGIPFRMQSVSRMPFRSTAGMNPHAPVAQPPPAMPKLKLVDPSSPSSVIPSSIKQLFQQLVQVRSIILSLGRAPLSDAWLAAVEYLAADAQLCLQDLHYLMLLAMLGKNHKKARSNDAASSSKATPAGSFQFGHAVDDKIRKITSILEKLINGGLELSRAVVRDDGYMLSVVALLSHCILLCRGISGITSVICVENMKGHQELPVAACDDLTCSGHGKIARMNAQTIPTCVADPIYLLPTAIRSLLYLDLSSCSDLTELPASLGTLHNLSTLNLSCCFSLYMLPESLGSLECLQILVLSFCWKLLFLPLSFGNLSKLRLLDISGCSSLEILPDSFVNLVHLENLNLSDCKRLKGIPQPFGNLQKLKYLNFSGCNRVELQVEYVRGLANLKCLTLSPQTDVHGFPDSLEYLAYYLDLSRWWKKNWVHPNCKPKAASLHLYGDQEQSIIARLLSQGSYDGDVTSEQSVTSICIVGESGMGKTELVHRVYNDQMILDAFNLRIWICMCDKKKLLEKIIEFITGTGEVPLSVLEETVREELIGKRFLLVLDDADIEEQCFWSDVLKLLNVGAEGSALIVTTKSEEVDRLVGEMQTIYLNPLSEEECFMVFQDHAFGDLDMNNCSHLANVGWKIVEKCGGNPMCVKALSGLLCHSEYGLPEIGALVDGIMPALRLCYDLLPAHLKRCFKFCSLFPKDYIFVKHYIVRLWISQGFIFPEEDRQPEDTGLHYFNELFCRSFFQRSPFHNDQEDKFVVHGLFHDLAHSVSRDECFRSEEPFCRLPENICHLSLVLQDSKTVVLSKEVTHLQSLLVVGRSDSRFSSTSVPVLNILHLNDIFVQGGFLSALNLSCAEILELPRSVGNMKHLRFLALNNTKINSLPSEIGQIDILETLELKDCCDLIELPESIKNLVKLRHLDVRKGPGNVHVGMPSGVGQLTDLQTLAIFNVGNDLLHCCIGDLKNLNGLRGHLRITGLENIKTGKDAREANLMSKHSIEALTMEWCYSSEEMEDDLCKQIANQVLQNLQPNSSLQELVIRNYSGNLFPIWMQDSSLCKLVSITIDDCKDCNELPSLGDLPYLKYLFIQKMNATNIIGYKSNSLATEEKHAPRFPSLEILNLWEMYDLQFWDGISDGDFPRLCRLSISRCPKLKNLPPFMSLLHLSFHFGGELPTFSELPMLKSLKIEGFHKLKSISLSLEMLMLKKLEISDCKELLSVDAPWLSISHLKVARCPKLHFRGCSLEGCSMWEMLQSGSQTKRSLLVKNWSDTDQHDDGWNWKKYDEKDILGSKFPRSYFRCNKYSMGCMARKTAERNNDDPNTWSVTYMSEHNHPQGDMPCIEPPHDLPIQLGTTRKRKEFHAHPLNAHESSTSNKKLLTSLMHGNSVGARIWLRPGFSGGMI